MEGNPLAEIRNTRKIGSAVFGGKVKESLQRMSAEIGMLPDVTQPTTTEYVGLGILGKRANAGD
jgi:hypothetical protein